MTEHEDMELDFRRFKGPWQILEGCTVISEEREIGVTVKLHCNPEASKFFPEAEFQSETLTRRSSIAQWFDEVAEYMRRSRR